MPDPKQMSGIPRPVTDLPDGSVSIRLIRGQLSNNITKHPVELHVGSRVMTVDTDDAGRAQFDKVMAGETVKAVAVVDGERLESQEFPAPARGGIRLMLVATDTSKGPSTPPAETPAVAGQVVLGGESRIVMEPDDEIVRVYYLLDIDNAASAPVNPPAPFVIDVPSGATSTTIMDGSTAKAKVTGTRVTVATPFPPGHSFLQVAYALPGGGGTIDLAQKLPANLEQLAVIVRKVGATTLASRQIAQQREMPAQGELYIAATGGAVSAGQPIELTLSGYPHHSGAPRAVALTLAFAIAAAGFWTAGRRQPEAGNVAAERKRLTTRREKLFNDLVRLEREHRDGRVDEGRYASRRTELVAALENVYGALDRDEPAAAPAVV